MKKGLIIIITIIVLILVVIGVLLLKNKNEINVTMFKDENLVRQTFNAQITAYIGENRNYQMIKALYSSVMIANQTRKVDILLNNKTFDLNDLKEDAKYNIDVEYDEEGYINKVIVKEVDM